MAKLNKGISIIESLVCIVIIGIGFIAIMQLSAFSINSMDRATERNKLNFLSEMVVEDMLGILTTFRNMEISIKHVILEIKVLLIFTPE